MRSRKYIQKRNYSGGKSIFNRLRRRRKIHPIRRSKTKTNSIFNRRKIQPIRRSKTKTNSNSNRTTIPRGEIVYSSGTGLTNQDPRHVIPYYARPNKRNKYTTFSNNAEKKELKRLNNEWREKIGLNNSEMDRQLRNNLKNFGQIVSRNENLKMKSRENLKSRTKEYSPKSQKIRNQLIIKKPWLRAVQRFNDNDGIFGSVL